MTSVAATLARPRARALLRRRPTWPVEALVAVSWLALVAGGGRVEAGWAAALPMWVTMTLAMMLPTALPAVRHVADHSLRRRRRQAMAEFLGVYVATWALAGVAILGALDLVPVAFPVILLAAAAWQLAPAKRWALRRCHRTAPLAPTGRRATRSVARFGVLNATGCVASCWALMAVSAALPAAQIPWMAALTVAAAAEKLAERPRAAARATALVLTAAAAVAVLV